MGLRQRVRLRPRPVPWLRPATAASSSSGHLHERQGRRCQALEHPAPATRGAAHRSRRAGRRLPRFPGGGRAGAASAARPLAALRGADRLGGRAPRPAGVAPRGSPGRGGAVRPGWRLRLAGGAFRPRRGGLCPGGGTAAPAHERPGRERGASRGRAGAVAAGAAAALVDSLAAWASEEPVARSRQETTAIRRIRFSEGESPGHRSASCPMAGRSGRGADSCMQADGYGPIRTSPGHRSGNGVFQPGRRAIIAGWPASTGPANGAAAPCRCPAPRRRRPARIRFGSARRRESIDLPEEP